MSGEPKTHTPQEALRLLRERGMELTFDSNDATPWAVYRDNGEYLNEYLHFGQSEEEVLSAALGVRVVARDEADELRAAVLDWWQARTDLDRAYPAWIRDLPEGESYAKYMAAAKEIGAKQQRVWDELREWARRLAGGENEK